MEVSNADRVVFPEDGLTKGDVVAYYQSVGDWMMPFVADRALTVERFPKGTGARGFMQKNAPEHLSDDLIDRHEVPKEDGGTTVYPVVKTPQAIAAFANLGVITFHVPPTTVTDDDRSDWIIWDLDPSSGDFDAARNAAHGLRDLLAKFAIETVVMVSGSNGYHLRTHLAPAIPSREAALIARGTAALGVSAHPDLMTLAFRKSEREDRVFVDWLRNAPYSTSVVPWSLRARSGAPVAVPIGWEEIDEVDPNGVRFEDVSSRFGTDAWSNHEPVDLVGMAEEVQSALDDAGITLESFDRFRS